MPLSTIFKRLTNIQRVEWRNVKEDQWINENNVTQVFDMESEPLKQESKTPAGCFGFFGRSHKLYTKLLVKKGQKSGKLTIFKDKILGKGSFGVISLGKLKARNSDGSVKKTNIAVKTIDHEKLRKEDYTDEDILAMIGDEVRALTRCEHPNIIGLEFVLVYQDETILGMELAKNGPLVDHFAKNPKVTCMEWCTKIMDAIHFCHERGVMHLDLKPENVLLDEDFNIKIADFGLSEVVEDVSTLTDDSFIIENEAGTQLYMAPEMFYGKTRNGRKCDVWSLGVIMYELLLNKRPFDDGELAAVSAEVNKMRKKRRSQANIRKYLEKVYDIDKVYFPPTFPIAPKVIICAMLNFDPRKRPYLDQITAVSWMSKFRVQNCNKDEIHGHQNTATKTREEGDQKMQKKAKKNTIRKPPNLVQIQISP